MHYVLISAFRPALPRNAPQVDGAVRGRLEALCDRRSLLLSRTPARTVRQPANGWLNDPIMRPDCPCVAPIDALRRVAKVKHGGTSFYGNSLSVGYAPTVDSLEDVRAKLEERVELLQRRRQRRKPGQPSATSGATDAAATGASGDAATSATAAAAAASAVAPEYSYESAAPVAGPAGAAGMQPASLGGPPPLHAAPGQVAVAARIRAKLQKPAGRGGKAGATPASAQRGAEGRRRGSNAEQ